MCDRDRIAWSFVTISPALDRRPLKAGGFVATDQDKRLEEIRIGIAAISEHLSTQDKVLAKLDSSLGYLWGKSFGDPNGSVGLNAVARGLARMVKKFSVWYAAMS